MESKRSTWLVVHTKHLISCGVWLTNCQEVKSIAFKGLWMEAPLSGGLR